MNYVARVCAEQSDSESGRASGRPMPQRPTALAVASLVGLLGICGCATTERDAGVAMPQAESEAVVTDKDKVAKSASTTTATAPGGEKAADSTGSNASEQEHELVRKERELAIAQERLSKARLAAAQAEEQHTIAVERAEREVALQQQRYDQFTSHTAPQRIGQAELGLRRTEDRVKESEEELHQLELMYGEEDFADQTKEIVLQRGRRRLERDQQSLKLQQQDVAFLKDKQLPLEKAEQELQLQRRRDDLEKARRDANASLLDNHIGVMSAENDVARLEEEISQLRQKIDKGAKNKADGDATGDSKAEGEE
jgi:hypothetical protein